MLKKHSLIFGIVISLSFLYISTILYPGGSQNDQNSIGYDWQYNYLSNLFAEKAVNGMDNPAQIWAIIGMFILCITFAVFFVLFSKKIPSKSASIIIKLCGVGSMIFLFLAVTPLHDLMITIASTLALIAMFYITVFIFKSKLHFFKVLSVVTLLIAYFTNYIYFTQSYLEILPTMQKVFLIMMICWVLSLHYFTRAEDFQLSISKAES